MREAAGFTLIELLVVMLLLSVVGALAASRFAGNLDRPALRTASNEVAAVLRQARSEAVIRNTAVVVQVDVDQRRFGIAGGRMQTVSDRLTLSLFTASSERLSASVGNIRFFPDGSSTGGAVTLRAEGMRSEVQIDWLTGRITSFEEFGGDGPALARQ